MAGHHTSEANPGSFNPYLEGMSYPSQYGLYPHHFSKLRGPHDLNYGDYPTKPQQAVPTYKWMQVKRNVPKPGKKTASNPYLLAPTTIIILPIQSVNHFFNDFPIVTLSTS